MVVLALDTPSIVIPKLRPLAKPDGTVRLIYLSLITAKKNLHFLLQVLHEVSEHITVLLDVFGPVKDFDYWSRCLLESKKLNGNIKFCYRGLADPDKVSDVIQDYHFLILPTLGENFGHAIYESLLAGRPVLISNKTPWKDLTLKKSGMVFSLSRSEVKQVIEDAANMNNETYIEFCQGAQRMALRYLEENDFRQQYLNLFRV